MCSCFITGFGVFRGHVIGLELDNDGEVTYRVEYDDGDVEDLDWALYVAGFQLQLRSLQKGHVKSNLKLRVKNNPKKEMAEAAVRDTNKKTLAGKQLEATKINGWCSGQQRTVAYCTTSLHP